MMDVELIAMVCHEANRAYCATLGDDTQPSWEDASDWQRESVIDGVTFFLRHPTAPAFMAHDNWIRTKEDAGWSYGEIKDASALTHPCMLPWNELPDEQKRKDILFHNIVFAMTAEM